jgi:hypothetical protein
VADRQARASARPARGCEGPKRGGIEPPLEHAVSMYGAWSAYPARRRRRNCVPRGLASSRIPALKTARSCAALSTRSSGSEQRIAVGPRGLRKGSKPRLAPSPPDPRQEHRPRPSRR